MNLYATYLALGKVAERLETAAEAIRFAPDSPHGYSTHAFTLIKMGRIGEAKAHLAKALELAPKDPEALAFTGLAESMRMRHHKAVERYDRSLKVRPGSAKVLVWRSRSLAPWGRFEEAERDAREAMKRDPTREAQARQILDSVPE